jgi:ubiquinone/menaquinone biosynthesis C-methylase UbiE
MIRKIKQLLKPLSHTPLHPQWLSGKGRNRLIRYLKEINENDVILDIGCFNQWPKQFISEKSTYIGLDYLETAQQWYKSVPNIYGDACRLPIKTDSIDVILLLDVLEHISSTEKALTEIHRVLKRNGKLIMQVPFLYPLHDEPRDYWRMTKYGFENLANQYNFRIEECHAIGNPVETSTLLQNIALTKTVINWFSTKNPALIFVIILPLFIIINNLFAKFLTLFSKDDYFMPYSYQIIMTKK